MRSYKVWLCCWAVGGRVMAVSPDVGAQSIGVSGTSDASPDNMLFEITVTAEKRVERLQDVPMSLNAATGLQLQSLGITNTDQLEKLVPGFTFEKTVYGLPVYFLRGIGFNDTSLGVSPAVTVYSDQLPLPYSPMARGAVLDIERVEVLKGPQGTLFGENSTGGAINYIASKPTDTFQSGVDLTYGRFNEADASVFVNGPITSTVSARLAIQEESLADWQKGYTVNESIGQKSFQNGRLIVDWRPDSGVKFESMVTGWVDGSATQQPQFVQYAPTAPVVPGRPVPSYPIGTVPAAPDDPRAAGWDPGTSFDRHDTFFQLAERIDVTLPRDMTLSSLSSYEVYNQRLPLDTDGTIYPIDVVSDLGAIHSFSQELRLNGSALGRMKWMFGANYERDTVDERLIFDPTLDGGDHLGPFYWTSFFIDNLQKVETKSAFASVDVPITETLTAQGSTRYTNQDRSFAGCARDSGNGEIAAGFAALSSELTGIPQTIAPGNCVTLSDTGTPLPIVTGKLNQDNVSWRGSLNWKVTPDALIYGNVTKGYKAGSFPTLPAATASQYVPVPQESVLAYETGFKTEGLAHKLTLDGALFYYDYIDKQLNGYLVVEPFGPLPSLVSIPKSDVKGAEVSVAVRPLTGLTLSISGTFIETRVNSNPINPTGPFGNAANFIGQPFPYTPRWAGVFDAQYGFPLWGGRTAYVGANETARSVSNGTLLSGSQTVSSEENLLKIPDYHLLDLRVGIEASDKRWRAEVWGRNVTNQFYETGATRNADYVTRFTGMPATFGISAHYRFD